MPRRFNNWTFNDVERFLKKRGFVLHHTNGSHFYYLGNGTHHICVPFHGSKTIKPRTLKGVILQSGIDQAEWFKG
jgi:predicted RNA binding protein YcfA (HicA-like mRNA interferase family)